MTRCVFLASLFHETHSFVDEITSWDSMKFRRGSELLARAGDGSTVDGFLGVAKEQGWQVMAGTEMAATPSGLIDDAIFEAYCSEVISQLHGTVQRIDAIWLSLHGAMVTTRNHDPEGDLLERIRALPGLADVPLFGVFDLHATMTERMATHADGLVAYRNNPHTDAHAAAALSARLLARCLATGQRPSMLHRTLPFVWPPTGTGTADVPMHQLNCEARRIEATDPAIWAVNVVCLLYTYPSPRDV
jgi:microcystin degradation protein MlrC